MQPFTIAIDIRALQERVGGIPEYTKNLVQKLIAIDTRNRYILFWNGFRSSPPHILNHQASNVRFVSCSYPNKLLNASLAMTHWPHLDSIIKRKTGIAPDLFFFPNSNFASVSSGVVTITTAHDLSFDLFPSLLQRKAYWWHRLVNPRHLIRASSRVISVSENTKTDLVRLYCLDPRVISVIPLGIDDQFFDLTPLPSRASLGLPERYILGLGVNQPRKNILLLIEAFGIIKKSGHFADLSLVLADSRHTLSHEIKRAINREGVSEWVRFLGPIPSQARRAVYTYADVFAYPTIYEGFGLPILEAAACATPIITGAHSSIGEIAGSFSLLIDPHNKNSLAEGLIVLLTSGRIKRRFQANAIDHIKQYSWERTARMTLMLFEQTIHDYKHAHRH